MYCERCGKQIEEALNFCNGCGAQLKKDNDTQQSALNLLITALIVIGTGGLGVLVGLLAVLLDKLPNPEPAFIFGLIYLGVLFGICFMIMRQVSKMIDAKLKTREVVETVKTSLVELPARTTAQLEAHREPASVTENTTRTLDEVAVGRRS